MKQVNENGAFTVDEFLAWARIGRTKFYQEIKEGRLRVRKLGRKTLVLKVDATDWLSSLPEQS